jgi:hypothetical protein
VIEAQLMDRQSPAAVLALVTVSSQNGATVQMNPLLGQAIVSHEPDHAGNLNLEIHGTDPVFIGLFAMNSQLTIVKPRLECVVGKTALLVRINDFGQFPAK